VAVFRSMPVQVAGGGRVTDSRRVLAS
jgi:hypothetical protein